MLQTCATDSKREREREKTMPPEGVASVKEKQQDSATSSDLLQLYFTL